MAATSNPRRARLGLLAVLGPGIAVAATGVGAGDVTIATLAGSRFGLALLWVPILAGILKFFLNEGLARYQLATGETLVEGWFAKLGQAVGWIFAGYLLVWTVSVFGALVSTTGVALDLLLPLQTMIPSLERPAFAGGPKLAPVVWGFLALIACVTLVWIGRYAVVEMIMSLLTLVMVGIVIGAFLLVRPMELFARQWELGAWWPSEPGTTSTILAILGGAGGTVTVLGYSYWMRERGREGLDWTGIMRWDLVNSYAICAIFGIGIMCLAGGVREEEFARILDLPADAPVKEPRLSDAFRVIAHQFEFNLGLTPAWGKMMSLLFKSALVATVASSLLGTLSAVPYLYADLAGLLARRTVEQRREMTRSTSGWYRGFLVSVALLPVPLVLWKQPATIAMIYAVWGSLFMPFLAATLLAINTRKRWVGELVNGWIANSALVICLAIFGYAASQPVVEAFTSLF